MNVVVVQGVLKNEPVERTLQTGVTVMDWIVSATVDGKSQTVPVQWTDPARAVQRFDQGDEVVVLGSVRQRFFRAGGALVSRTEVVGDAVSRPRQQVSTRKILERAQRSLVVEGGR